MITVFALANGRSGTRFLCHLLRSNLKNAICRHEPYFDWGNPSMFGPPIHDIALTNIMMVRVVAVSLLTRAIRWRGVVYRIAGPWRIRVVEYRPYVDAVPADVEPDLANVQSLR